MCPREAHEKLVCYAGYAALLSSPVHEQLSVSQSTNPKQSRTTNLMQVVGKGCRQKQAHADKEPKKAVLFSRGNHMTLLHKSCVRSACSAAKAPAPQPMVLDELGIEE